MPIDDEIIDIRPIVLLDIEAKGNAERHPIIYQRHLGSFFEWTITNFNLERLLLSYRIILFDSRLIDQAAALFVQSYQQERVTRTLLPSRAVNDKYWI
jgi:hypothetical protein